MNVSIAIPDSCLIDEATQLDKSRKISSFARSCAIFKINTIYVYEDKGEKKDRSLLVTILKYLETPPFLRKRLFQRINELKFAGVLHPLKIPSHTTPSNVKKINDGDIREGVIISLKGKKLVDVGINHLFPYFGKKQVGKRLTVQFKKRDSELNIKEILKEDSPSYWGYSVKERGSLSSFLPTWKDKVILTSRKGKNISNMIIKEYQNSNEPILIVFGSTDKGIHEILGGKLKQIQNAKILNFFPNQATETIRIEEALLGTLSILNAV